MTTRRSQIAVEPYQCCFDIVKQSLPRSGRCSGPRDEHIVVSRASVTWQKFAGSFPKSAARPVPDNCAANFSGGGKALAQVRAVVLTVDGLNHDQAPPDCTPFCGAKKFAPNPETTDMDIYALSVDQTLAAFSPTGRKDFASVFSRHAAAEPVGTGTLQTAWLECAFHGLRPFESLGKRALIRVLKRHVKPKTAEKTQVSGVFSPKAELTGDDGILTRACKLCTGFEKTSKQIAPYGKVYG